MRNKMNLKIRNFGPIKDVNINIRKLTLLIGPQASGKSVISKLYTIFNDLEFIESRDIHKFLDMYNIEYGIHDDTFIEFFSGSKKIQITKEDITYKNDDKVDSSEGIKIVNELYEEAIKRIFNNSESPLTNIEQKEQDKLIKLIPLFLRSHVSILNNNCVFVPAERIIVPLLNDIIYTLILNRANMPYYIAQFANMYLLSKKKVSELSIPFLQNTTYSTLKDKDFVNHNNRAVELYKCSSGMQSSIPMSVVIEYQSNLDGLHFIIEEPEQNLFPNSQKSIVEYLTEKCLKKNNSLIVTTHSPYIISAFSNLIQIKNAVDLYPANEKTAMKIIPKKQWIDFDNTSAYYIENGKCKDILSYSDRTIDTNAIDKASDRINREFDKILDLKYPE